MEPVALSLLPLTLLLLVAPCSADPTATNIAMNYLEKYRYLGRDAVDPNMKVAEISEGPKLHEAIRAFQRMAGLPQTGAVDARTLEMMKKPRCGIPDVSSLPTRARSKRYALLGSKWEKNDLTYRILTYSRQMSQAAIDHWIREAFKTWSSVTPLRFYQIYHGKADIEIVFGSHHHGDPYPFDGTGNTLAHAFQPGLDIGGDAHFDESERWILRDPTPGSGTDLYTVAVHEFGHSLGLSHSYSPNSIMRPFYDYVENLDNVLTSDDIAGVQYLYGSGEHLVPTTPRPTPQPTNRPYPTRRPYPQPTTTPQPTRGPLPSYCKREVHFDAIVTTNSGRTYAFEGWQYVYTWNGGELDTASPRFTSEVFQQLHWGVDTAFSLKHGNREIIYIFKSWLVWTYDANSLQQLSAKVPLQRMFPDLPSLLDAAFRWYHDGYIYAFKGAEYWKLVMVRPDLFKAEPGYPRSVADWNLPGRSINAAMSWSVNGRTYFFDGRDYYKYDDNARKVEPGYPRKLNVWWLRCPDEPQGLNLGATPDAVEGLSGSTTLTSAGHVTLLLLTALTFFFSS